MAVNTYASSEYRYAEIIKTLEDYYYGNNVKCSILSLMPLLNKSDVLTTTNYLNNSNIMNVDKSRLHIDRLTTCNYVNIIIPERFYVKTYEDEDYLKGYKGDQFVIMPIGGNITNYVVIGRSENIG